MRLHFQEQPWDLYAGVGYTGLSGAALLAFGDGNVLAILLVLFVPGYVLVAALFPKNLEIDWIERLGISFGLSIAVVPLLGLLLNFTPFGIEFVPIIAAITLFTIGVGFAAYWRRMHLPAEQRLSLTVDLGLPEWDKYSALDKGLTLALTASIAVAGGSFAYLVLTPHPREAFTEFYLLGPGGNASGYPTKLNVSQPGSVILGIANHEAASLSYTVRIDLVGVGIVFNATSGSNETVEVNRTTWSAFNVTLTNGQNWTLHFSFTINYIGLWKVQFLLFRDGDLSSAYRVLHLYIRVN